MIKKDFDNRIREVVSLIDKKVLIEIGADHGYISKCAMDTKDINFVYLTDISGKCIEKAKRTFGDKKYKNKTCFLVGDGLDALDEVTIDKDSAVVVIAGMGGNEIKKILAKNSGYKNFVLQPQKNSVELRQFLNDQNYKILVDKKIRDKKFFYDIISVVKDTKRQRLSKLDFLFGRTNFKEKNINFEEFLKYKRDIYNKILKEDDVKKLKDEKKELERAKKKLDKRRLI